jgi:hypothetical protein
MSGIRSVPVGRALSGEAKLEAAYQAKEIRDYPLFPAGRLKRGALSIARSFNHYRAQQRLEIPESRARSALGLPAIDVMHLTHRLSEIMRANSGYAIAPDQQRAVVVILAERK